MVLLCKQKALYVKCCIIPNGVTDSQGDTLYSEDIKKIFTTFNNQDNFEIYHNDIPIQEVSLLENYISTTDESIGTAVVPSGSWNAVIRVDNPEIKDALLAGEFKGVSLNNRIAEPCKANLTGQVRYQDIADAECIIPLLISFTGTSVYLLFTCFAIVKTPTLPYIFLSCCIKYPCIFYYCPNIVIIWYWKYQKKCYGTWNNC